MEFIFECSNWYLTSERKSILIQETKDKSDDLPSSMDELFFPRLNNLLQFSRTAVQLSANVSLRRWKMDEVLFLCSKDRILPDYFKILWASKGLYHSIPVCYPQWSVLSSIFNEQVNLVDVLSCEL